MTSSLTAAHSSGQHGVAPGYAVIDFETTGFSKQDRVLEVAVVVLDSEAHVVDEWSTLVNPQRHFDPNVHGILPRDVLGAPTFAEVAPLLLAVLRQRVFVAHNASFDTRFLQQEMCRVKPGAEALTVANLCTQKLAMQYLKLPSHKLVDCCQATGISLDNAHCALADARATAQLFSLFLRSLQAGIPWGQVLRQAQEQVWQVEQTAPNLLDRETSRQLQQAMARPGGWISLVSEVSRIPWSGDTASYCKLLDAALLDAELSGSEVKSLLAEVDSRGWGREDLAKIHREYLRQWAAQAWADGVITVAEAAELRMVGTLLGLPASDVDELLHRRVEVQVGEPTPARGDFGLQPGDRVVVTGPKVKSSEEWEQLLLKLGFSVGGVTKGTKLLVAGDVDSQSGKAKKARGYCIPVVSEEAFLKVYSPGHL